MQEDKKTPTKIRPVTMEDMVFKSILTNFKGVRDDLEPYIFDKDIDLFLNHEYVVLFKQMAVVHTETDHWPTLEELFITTQNEKILSAIMFVKSIDMSGYNEKISTDIIIKYIKRTLMTNVLAEGSFSLHEGNFDDCLNGVETLSQLYRFGDNTPVQSIEEDLGGFLEAINEGGKAIPSALSFVNSTTTGGGWHRSAVSCFQGQPGSGKTGLLCNEAAYAYTHGHNVLYITLEMSELVIRQRIIANITDIPIYNMKTATLESISTPMQNPKYGKLSVIYKDGSTNPSALKAEIDRIENANKLKFDILIVDYAQKMKSNSGSVYGKNATMYTEGQEIFDQLRNLIAIPRDIAVLTATQTSKDGYNTLSSSMKNTAGSSGVNEIADYMITISKDDTLWASQMLFHVILKNRFGAEGNESYSKADFSRMKIRAATFDEVSKLVTIEDDKPKGKKDKKKDEKSRVQKILERMKLEQK